MFQSDDVISNFVHDTISYCEEIQETKQWQRIVQAYTIVLQKYSTDSIMSECLVHVCRKDNQHDRDSTERLIKSVKKQIKAKQPVPTYVACVQTILKMVDSTDIRQDLISKYVNGNIQKQIEIQKLEQSLEAAKQECIDTKDIETKIKELQGAVEEKDKKHGYECMLSIIEYL